MKKNPDIIVHEFGLANHSKCLLLNVNQDSSSLFKLSNNKEIVQVVKAADFFIKNQIKTVDLIKINIEGAEYDLLEHLLDSDWVKKIKNIQVQFHSFVPEAELRMKVIQNRLSDTHELTYSYTFVWENWKLKE